MLLLGQVFFGKDVLDALPCGVAVTNSLGYIILWNQHMAELTGISPHQAEGELIFRWFPELETMAVNARVPFYRSGRRVHFRVQSQAVAQGRSWAFQAEDTQVPEALQADLVSMVSHEVRVPLTSIKGFVDTLLRSRDQLNEEQQVRFLTIIKNQADRLSRLVEDLLSMARLQSGRMRNLPEGVQVRPVLERVLENLAQVSNSHSLLWEITPDLPSVWADEDRLEQIFTNLLDNAFKSYIMIH